MTRSLHILITVIILAVLVCITAFFTSSETAYLSIQRITLRKMLKEKKRGATKIAFLKAHMDELLTLVLVGTNFVSTLSSALATALALEVVGAGGVGIATLIITFFITTFGEIIPKTVAAVKPESVAGRFAPALIFLAKILFPVDWLFTKVAQGVNILTGHIWKKDAVPMTQEELKTLIAVGENEGALETGEKIMLYKLFEFGDLHVYDIMQHRSLIKSVPEKADRKEVVTAFSTSGFSRLPVYGSDSDTITGVIHYKSVLFRNQDLACGDGFARSCMQPVLFVPETLSVLELLLKFRKEKADFAVALNEHGSTAGIVTVDDLMRAVFGRMTDEDSLSEIPPEQRVKILPGGEFIVPGDMKLRDVNEILDMNLESDYYTTLGGWLLERFDSLPSIGQALKYQKALFIVEDQLLRRIVSVRIKLL